jgi:nucleoside-diphosphate-sugar epimerase
MMKILLTGATGFIGSHIEKALQLKGLEVIPISRSHGYDANKMLLAEEWLSVLDDVDCVINAMGIIRETGRQSFGRIHTLAAVALFEACEQLSIKRVIQISALGADEQASTPFLTSKKQADDYLRNRNCDWFVLRPSLVYGEGGASSAMLRRLAALPLIPVIGKGEQMLQPVAIKDLVDTVMQCIDSHDSRQTLDVVGPVPISYLDWLQLMRQQLGKSPAPTLKLPFDCALVIAGFARHLNPLMEPDNIRMLQQGNTADVTPLANFIGHMPQNVENQ